MKRNIPGLLLIMILAMAMMFTGCGGSESAPEMDPQQSEESASSGDVEAAETDNDGLEGMGDLLSSAYVDMMKNNEYFMKYKANVDYDGQAMEMEVSIASKGDDVAIISDAEGIENNMIIKDDKIYMVDHTGKTVTTWAQTPEEDDASIDVGNIDTEGITYVGQGTEDGLVFEEYTTLDSTMKYYFDGKDLVRISITIAGSDTMIMDILEMSKNVPASMFEIPAGYQVIEF